MSFLSPIPALVAAAITIPLLVGMYFLKLRRKQVAVSSTLLWKKAIQDMQVNSPFQKMRRNLLLLLQLLLLIALLLAMARPTFETAAQPGQRVVIVIDHSASMNATDAPPSRLAQAKADALRLVDQLNTSSARAANGVMVVSFAQNARVVQPFTSDPGKLRAAINSIQPTDEPSHITPALELIQPYATASQASKKKSLLVYVLTDGRTQSSDVRPPSLAGADVRPVILGQKPSAAGSDNLGIVAFSARRQFDHPQMVQVFARVDNAFAKAITTNLTLRIDGQVAQVQSLAVPPAAGGTSVSQNGRTTWPALGSRSVQFSFRLPGSAVLSLSLDHPDILAADNTARLVLAPAKQLRVLLVTAGNAFLSRVIKSVGVHDLVQMTPAKYETQNPASLQRARWNSSGASAGVGDGFDVIVFDHYSPKTIPPVASLYFDGIPPIKHLAIRPAEKDSAQAQMILDWQRDDPLLRYVDLSDVVLRSPGRLALPSDATVLATGEQGPLIAELNHDGRTQVFTSFDILESNWPLYVSFPVFMSNTLQTLGLGALGDQAGIDYSPGQSIVIPVATSISKLTYQSGKRTITAYLRRGRAVLPPPGLTGLYHTAADIAPPYDQLAVNLLDAGESDVRPASMLQVATSAGSKQVKAGLVHQEIWPWFVWIALGFLLIEWFVYTQRMRL